MENNKPTENLSKYFIGNFSSAFDLLDEQLDDVKGFAIGFLRSAGSSPDPDGFAVQHGENAVEEVVKMIRDMADTFEKTAMARGEIV